LNCHNLKNKAWFYTSDKPCTYMTKTTWICFEWDNNPGYFGFNFNNRQFYNLYQIWFRQNLKSLFWILKNLTYSPRPKPTLVWTNVKWLKILWIC
jgi:hypothetical protein